MAVNQSSAAEAARKVGMRELVSYFLRLGLMGFGGPVALAGKWRKNSSAIASG
jgi:chromate transport protein ChrA